MDELAAQDKFRLAAETGLEMLRLCQNDNLGIRFSLMDYYAILQEQKPAEKLFKKYKSKTALLSLPMSYMYYQLGDENKSKEHLQIMLDNIKDTKKFFISKGTIPACYQPSHYGTQLGTMDEYYECFSRAPRPLYENAEYWEWAKETIKSMKKKLKNKNSLGAKIRGYSYVIFVKSTMQPPHDNPTPNPANIIRPKLSDGVVCNISTKAMGIELDTVLP